MNIHQFVANFYFPSIIIIFQGIKHSWNLKFKLVYLLFAQIKKFSWNKTKTKIIFINGMSKVILNHAIGKSKTKQR